jgi:hypothetical protein
MLGCGGGSSTDASGQQIELARREGEEAAQERARIKNLQHQVRDLKKEVHKSQPATVVVTESGSNAPEPPPAAADDLRTFHAPSGNVSCEVGPRTASCSVVSAGKTFVLPSGEEARLESGVTLPRGAGELAPYGSTITVGSVICSVPQSSEPRGITCSDSDTGHGFEASRVPDRQSIY